MRKIYELESNDIVPVPLEVLILQKMTERSLSPRIMRTMDDAFGIFKKLARPCGLLEAFSADDFPDLYQGKGLNEADCPVPSIVARSTATALMAATLGEAPAVKCSELFAEGSTLLGYMLNAVCSAASERLGHRLCHLFFSHLCSEPREFDSIKVQYYCPGHCGWHISGQEKLFTALRPEEIGMSLGENWVMRPFKSISGILVAAPLDVHRFRQLFSSCPKCRDRKCVERLELLEMETAEAIERQNNFDKTQVKD